MLATLERVLVNNNGLFLNLRDLLIHLHNAVLGKTTQTRFILVEKTYSISLRMMLISVLRY